MNEKVSVVKRAIIMAAGTGKRMMPLTLEVPKPLVKVNGVRMIDTVVDGLYENNIYDIYVVVGHLKNQFYEWANGKTGVTIIENPYYRTCNNISSLFVAREYLEDCIILDGDQYIYNSNILDARFTYSGYNAVWCENTTDEWLLTVDNGLITGCSRTGGINGWQLYSISRWTAKDGRKLRKHLEHEFNSGNKQLYWDDVVMFCHFNEYKLGIRKMENGDVIEIDDLDELIQIDKSYVKYKIGG